MRRRRRKMITGWGQTANNVVAQVNSSSFTAAGFPDTTIATAPGTQATVGKMVLVFGVGGGATPANWTVTDSKSNTWNRIAYVQNGSNFHCVAWYSIISVAFGVATSITITQSSSAALGITAYILTGQNASPLDGYTGTSGSGLVETTGINRMAYASGMNFWVMGHPDLTAATYSGSGSNSYNSTGSGPSSLGRYEYGNLAYTTPGDKVFSATASVSMEWTSLCVAVRSS